MGFFLTQSAVVITTAAGTADGYIFVADGRLFPVGASVVLDNNTVRQPAVVVEAIGGKLGMRFVYPGVTTNYGRSDCSGFPAGTKVTIAEQLAKISTAESRVAVSDLPDIRLAETYNDAFGRVRVSEPMTLLDGKFLYTDNPLLWDTVASGVGSGITQPGNTGMVELKCDANGSKTVRQTRRYLVYQPGKSLKMLWTAVLAPDGVVTGVTVRAGYYDDAGDKTVTNTEVSGNGYFFQLSGGVLSVVRRSYISGVQTDTVFSRAEWNVDRLDGHGPSGVDIDVTKIQIFWMDEEFLGAGTIRIGVVHDGRYIIAHKFHHANRIATFHTQTASLPVRYEIIRAVGAGAAKMLQGCCTVISEGGYNPRGVLLGADRGVTTITATAAALVPVISLRSKVGRCRGSLRPRQIQLLATGANNQFRYAVVYGIANYAQITLTGASWTSAHTSSLGEYDVSATAFSGGIMTESGYSSSNDRSTRIDLETDVLLGASIAGEADIVTIAAQAVGSNCAMLGAISWQEVF